MLTDVREADVGSILGFGYAPYSGGTLSYIDMMGTKKFVALCEKLAQKYGERFKPNKLLVEMAHKGESFYGRFAPEAAEAGGVTPNAPGEAPRGERRSNHGQGALSHPSRRVLPPAPQDEAGAHARSALVAPRRSQYPPSQATRNLRDGT